MEYRKIDTFFVQSVISHDMIKQANMDLVGYEKRRMTNKLTDQAINKYTNNVLLKIKFSEEDIDPEKMIYNGHAILSESHKRIRGVVEVYSSEL